MRGAKGVVFVTDDPCAFRDMLHDFLRYCHEAAGPGLRPGTMTIHDTTEIEGFPFLPREDYRRGRVTWETRDPVPAGRAEGASG